MGWLSRRRDRETVITPETGHVPDRVNLVRDPRGATGTASYYQPGMRMPPTWDATLAVERGYEASVAVHRCVNAIASALTRSPFRAGADPDNPKDFSPNSALALLLGPMTSAPGLAGRPAGTVNQSTSARSLWHWTVAQWLVTGRFGWEIDTTAAGRPVALWPLVARLLTPVPTGRGSDHYFAKFVYGLPVDEVTFTPEEVVYGWLPSQGDWRMPESPLQAARLPISTVVTQGQYDYAFLTNGGVPAHVVVHPAIDDDEKREAYRRQFTADHHGAANAGRTAFTEFRGDDARNVLHVETIGQSAKDQQAEQRYRMYSDEVYIALGTPRSIAGDASGRTFDNASQEYLNWHEGTVEPLAQRFAEFVNTQLAPRLGSEAGWFDFSAVRAARKRFNPYEGIALARAGMISREEVRAELDMPEDTEQLDAAGTSLADRVQAYATLLANGYTPETAAEIAGLDVPPDGEMPAAEVASEDQPSASEPAAGAPEAIPLEIVRVRDRPDPGVRRAKLWTEADRRIRAHEVLFARAMARLFNRQEAAVRRALAGKRGRQAMRGPEEDPAALFDVAYWTEQTRDDAEELFRAVHATAGAGAADVLGLELDVLAPYASEFVRTRANQLAGPVVDTTYGAIRDTLRAGAELGEGVPELSARVGEVFEQAGRVRAPRIARTEVVSAFNGSAWLVGQQVGEDLAAGQEWIATRDARTRETHAEVDGQVVGIRDTFAVGGNALHYPGDPAAPADEVVNCRCTLAFLTPDEMAERTRPVPFTRARDLISMVARRELAAADLERISA